MDLGPTLLDTQSPDANVRGAAEARLAQAEQHSAGALMHALVAELASEQRQPEVRQLAGLIFKNLLFAKDKGDRTAKGLRWVQTIDAGMRQDIKSKLVATLASEVQPARRSAAMALAEVAYVELPRQMWPELVSGLLNFVTQPNNTLKEAALESLGYICEEIDPSVLRMQAREIITAVFQGMSEVNETVKFTACVALFNSLGFLKDIFDVQEYRRHIMTKVCECCTYANNNKVREAGYECLVRVVELYYDLLPEFMDQLFKMTVGTMQSDTNADVVQQAVEFWSSLCDEEIERIQAFEDGESDSNECRFFTKAALQWLVPQLLVLMTKQEEDQDEDTWDCAMAASTCLSLVSLTVREEVVPFIVPFVKDQCNSDNWRFREAAMMAFGCIMEGPSPASMKSLVCEGLDVVLHRMSDPVVNVKDTATWTLGRICEFQEEHLSTEMYSKTLTVCMQALKDEPRVASLACWAIHNLYEANEDDADEDVGRLSPYWPQVFAALVECCRRDDLSENHLRGSCFETMNMMIMCAARDMYPNVRNHLALFLGRLSQSFQTQILSQDDKRELNELQALLCGCISAVCMRLGAQVGPIETFDAIMHNVLLLFNYKEPVLYEEALMTIGAVANCVEGQFARYMGHVMPVLTTCLSDYENYRVCNTAVGVVGDVTRALQRDFLQFATPIVQYFVQLLQQQKLHKSVKPAVLAAFGDIGLAICGAIDQYLPYIMPLINQACTFPLPTTTPDQAEFADRFREAILDAFTGIVQGLKTDQKQLSFLTYAQLLVRYCEELSKDDELSEDVTRAAVGVIGDLASALGQQVAQLVKSPHIFKLLDECGKSSDSQSKETAKWTRTTLNRL